MSSGVSLRKPAGVNFACSFRLVYSGKGTAAQQKYGIRNGLHSLRSCDIIMGSVDTRKRQNNIKISRGRGGGCAG